MNRSDTAKIMAILSAAYPGFYSKQSKDENLAAISLWADFFVDDDPGVVLAAVKAHLATDTKGFPPVIGQIREQVTRLTQPPQMTETEAWGLVYRAICNSGYHPQREFDNLPPLLKQVVGSPAQLRAWSQLDDGEVQTVVASHFLRSYRAAIAAQRENQALHGSIRERMDALTENGNTSTLPLPEGTDESAAIFRELP